MFHKVLTILLALWCLWLTMKVLEVDDGMRLVDSILGVHAQRINLIHSYLKS